MAECAACGAHIGPDDAECASCGLPAPGKTASFEPVHDDQVPTADVVDTDGPALVVRKGPQPGERFYLDRPSLSVGRDPESDIFLNDMTVSRAHAVLETVSGTVTVKDEGSLNGTYVNGVCVDVAPLHPGDVLQIGTFQMVFLSPERDAR